MAETAVSVPPRVAPAPRSRAVVDPRGAVADWASVVATFVSRMYLVFLATLLVIAVLPTLGSWSSLVVRSDSMEPGIHRGDVVVVSPFSADDTKVPVGRVLAFRNPVAVDGHHTVLVHRVVENNRDGTYTTKGDHNRTTDSSPVAADDFFGRGRLLVPRIGLPILWWWSHDWAPLGLWLLVTALAVYFAFRRLVPRESDDGDDDDRSDPSARRDTPIGPTDGRAPWSARAAFVLVVAVLAVLAAQHFGAADAAFSDEARNAGNSWAVLPAPDAPRNPTAVQTGPGAADFTWAAPTSGQTPTEYRVYVDATLVATVDASTFAASTTGLAATSHTLSVTAVNAIGESAPASVVFTILPTPDAPQSPAAVQTAAGTARFTWAAPALGATPSGYHVFVDDALVATLNASTFTYTRSGLTTGDHTFVVTAYNEIGDSPAATATVEIVTAPGTPTSTAATQTGAGTARYTWAAPTSGGTPAGYYVYVDNVKVATVSPTTFEYTATGLTTGSHSFAASTFNAMGESSKASRSLTIIAPPNVPRSLSVSRVGAGRIRITWSAPSGGGTVAGYRIYRSTTNDAATATLLASTTSRTYTDATAAVGTRYYYWVSAYNVAGESALAYAGNATG